MQRWAESLIALYCCGWLSALEPLDLDGRKRAFKNGHARVETRVLKMLACRNFVGACRKNVGGFSEHW